MPLLERNRAIAGGVSGVLVLACLAYLPYLGKGLVSEDFLLIALHREEPPWRDLAATFTRPWLDMTLFEFYRPVAALAFGAEANWFGGRSAGYNVVHLAVHLLATALVWSLLRTLLGAGRAIGSRCDGALELAALAGALYFGLYPLAPNAVLFAASFATVFGAAATLGAALLYVRWREAAGAAPRREPAAVSSPRASAGAAVDLGSVRGAIDGGRLRRSVPLAALGAYAIALGCYESSVALLLWLALYEASRRLLAGGSVAETGEARRRSRRTLVALAPFTALSAGYLALRMALFGDPLGGYGDVAVRLREVDLGLPVQALRVLARLPAPWFGPGAGAAIESLVALGLWGAAGLWVASAPAPSRRALLRAFLLGSGWAVVFLAPFSFPLVAPAAGRYWYLAAGGVALALASVGARAGAVRLPVRRRVATAAIVLVVASLLGRNLLLLQRHLGWMEEAATLATEIRDEIVRAAGGMAVTGSPDAPQRILGGEERRSSGGSPAGAAGAIFVADYPLFLRGGNGIELAQVYHYGLRAAAGPPFHDRAIDVYPLPPRSDGDPRRLALDHPVYLWSQGERALRRLDPAGADLPVLIDAGGPPDGAVVALDDAPVLRLRVEASADGARTQVVVSAAGNYTVERPASGGGEIRLPAEFLGFWASLAPGPQLWWMEVRDPAGRAVAQSPPRWLTVDHPRK